MPGVTTTTAMCEGTNTTCAVSQFLTQLGIRPPNCQTEELSSEFAG